MNKIYSVSRISEWDSAREIYTGRIRDCKKSLETIGEEYKKRGWDVKEYDFSLIIRGMTTKKIMFVYLIHCPNYEKQNNSCHRR